MLLKSDSKVHEKKDSKNIKDDKIDPPIILKYIKNQVITYSVFAIIFYWIVKMI